MRETRQTELPVTFTAQELSDNEFCESTEDLSTFLHTGSASKTYGGESSASTSGGAGYYFVLIVKKLFSSKSLVWAVENSH